MAAYATPPGSPPAPIQQRRQGRPRLPTPRMPPPNYHPSLRHATSQAPQLSTRNTLPDTEFCNAFHNVEEDSTTTATSRPSLSPSLRRQRPSDLLETQRSPQYSGPFPLPGGAPLTAGRARFYNGYHIEESVDHTLQGGRRQVPVRPTPEETIAYVEGLPGPLRNDLQDLMRRRPAAGRNAIEEAMAVRTSPTIEDIEQDLRRARTQLREFQERDESWGRRRALYRHLEDAAFGAINVSGEAQAFEAARVLQNMGAERATRIGDQQTQASATVLLERNRDRHLRRQVYPDRPTMADRRRRIAEIFDTSSQYESAFGLAADGLRASRCPACTDEVTDETGAFLRECGHKWHIECLNRCFKVALSSKQHFPPRCCRSILHMNRGCIDYASIKEQLDDEVVDLWNERAEEWLATDPTYCQTQGCTGGFISQAQIASGSAHCLVCEHDMCVECKAPSSAHINGSHPNMLSEADKALMEERKWKQCPNLRCRKVLERTDGCDHMTCSECGEQFCYRCGQKQSPASVGCTCVQDLLPTIARARLLRPNAAYRNVPVGPHRVAPAPGPLEGLLGGTREERFQVHPVQRAPRTPFSSRAPSPTRHWATRDRERLERHVEARIAEERRVGNILNQNIRGLRERSEELRRLDQEQHERLMAMRRQTGGGRDGGYA